MWYFWITGEIGYWLAEEVSILVFKQIWTKANLIRRVCECIFEQTVLYECVTRVLIIKREKGLRFWILKRDF